MTSNYSDVRILTYFEEIGLVEVQDGFSKGSIAGWCPCGLYLNYGVGNLISQILKRLLELQIFCSNQKSEYKKAGPLLALHVRFCLSEDKNPQTIQQSFF